MSWEVVGVWSCSNPCIANSWVWIVIVFFIRNLRIFVQSTEIITMSSLIMKTTISEDSPQFLAPTIRLCLEKGLKEGGLTFCIQRKESVGWEYNPSSRYHQAHAQQQSYQPQQQQHYQHQQEERSSLMQQVFISLNRFNIIFF